MAVENVDLRRSLFSLLSADSTLTDAVTGIYADLAPQGTALPYVVYNPQAGSDENSLGSERMTARKLFQVKVITEGESFTDAATAANRIDALLQGTRITVDSYHVTWRRESTVDYIENDGDQRYNHLGGIYAALLSSSV